MHKRGDRYKHYNERRRGKHDKLIVCVAVALFIILVFFVYLGTRVIH